MYKVYELTENHPAELIASEEEIGDARRQADLAAEMGARVIVKNNEDEVVYQA